MKKYKVKSRLFGGGFLGFGATDISGVDFVEANSEEEAQDKMYKTLRMKLVSENMEDDYMISITDVEESA